MTAVAPASVPNIQQQPRTVHDTAIHYGYCAFKNINLAGSLGQEHFVQPSNSPYYKLLPAKELIPFTNIEIHEHRPSSSGIGGGHLMNQHVTIQAYPKTAKECVQEMVTSYEEWGYQSLTPLIGLPEDEAFHIFQTIQPFLYILKDLPEEMENAESRIEQHAPYVVNYKDDSIELEPLPAHLKEIAEKTRQIMAVAVKTGFTLAEQTKDDTNLKLITAYSGGGGKRTPDPHDKYIASQLEHDFPKLLDNKVSNQTTTQSGMSEAEFNLRQAELAETKRTNDLRERDFLLKANPQITVEQEPKTKCGDSGGLNGKNEPCQMSATTDGRCAKHPREEQIAA